VDLRGADLRELILKAAKRLGSELQLVARLLGQLPGTAEQSGPTVNVLVSLSFRHQDGPESVVNQRT
jgi:hypothetical protein